MIFLLIFLFSDLITICQLGAAWSNVKEIVFEMDDLSIIAFTAIITMLLARDVRHSASLLYVHPVLVIAHLTTHGQHSMESNIF
ncbi:hypothetical protein GJ496_002504 [Pomphorhynchus laevis]|nr:hypothetical protein GJ496_002504 [Pomphorhynchus laevis]